MDRADVVFLQFVRGGLHFLFQRAAIFMKITPYKDQKELIIQELQKQDITHDINSDIVMTVHGSQGREWDTVLFSVSDTTNKWFTDSANKQSNGLNVINTAVSRAKKKLIIVCDYQYWKRMKKQLICKLLNVSHAAY